MPSIPIEAVLFDAGGTLVTLDYPFIVGLARRDGVALDAAALPAAEARARLAVDRAVLSGGAGDGDAARRAGYFTALFESLGIAGESVPRLVRALDRAHREANLWRLPQAGALETLRGLRARGVRTAVVSNADGRAEAVLRRAGLAAELEFVVDSHFEGVEKPDPEIFRRALARLGAAPERVAYVGDIYSIDALGARAAGLTPFILDPLGSYGELDCAKLAALGELLGWIASPARDGA